MHTKEKVILAADGLELAECVALVRRIGARIYCVKVHDLNDEYGATVLVGQLKDAGAERVWIDLKLDDVPRTMGRRAKRVARAGADILTVMAHSEIDGMMEAVANGPPLVLAVSVLTSMSPEQAELTYNRSVKASVLYFARQARLANVHGLVASPLEVAMLRKRRELHAITVVTPGVRSPGADVQDQQRVDTHEGALDAGSDYLVVGTEITNAPNPIAFLDSLEERLAARAANIAVATSQPKGA